MSDENENKRTRPVEHNPSNDEPTRRWGDYSYDDGDLLEFYILAQDATLSVTLSEGDYCALGRPNKVVRNQEDTLANATTDGTLLVMSKEDRQRLIALSGESRETRERALRGFSPDTPLVDLEPYGAVEAGVSRRHALLERIKRVVYITDLQSYNGTRLNGDGLVSMQPRIVRDGDELKLGNLVLKVNLRKLAGSEDDDLDINLGSFLGTSDSAASKLDHIEVLVAEENPASATQPAPPEEILVMRAMLEETKPSPPRDSESPLPDD